MCQMCHRQSAKLRLKLTFQMKHREAMQWSTKNYIFWQLSVSEKYKPLALIAPDQQMQSNRLPEPNVWLYGGDGRILTLKYLWTAWTRESLHSIIIRRRMYYLWS